MLGHRVVPRKHPGGTKQAKPVLGPIMSLLVSAAEPTERSHMLGILVGTLATEPGILAFLLAIGKG